MDTTKSQKPSSYTGPEIVIPRRVLNQMGQESMQHMPTETGQAMLGVRTPTQLIVLTCIPDIQDTVRQAAYFVQGGNDQVAIFEWINKHWGHLRASSRGDHQLKNWNTITRVPKGQIPVELDLPLEHIGDWHKHPGQLKTLSSTDLNTIHDILRTTRRKEYLAPIITSSSGAPVLTFTTNGLEMVGRYGMEIQLNWYYFNKNDQQYWHIVPNVVENYVLPWMPPLPWYLKDPERMQFEIAELRRHGCQVKWTVRNMDEDMEMEIIFALDRDDWSKRVVITTQYDYPKSRPLIRLYPKVTPNKSTETHAKRSNKRWTLPFEEWLSKIFAPQPGYDNIWDPYPQPWMNWQEKFLVDFVTQKEEELRYEQPTNT